MKTSNRRSSNLIVSGILSVLSLVAGISGSANAAPDKACSENGAANGCYQVVYHYVETSEKDYSLLSLGTDELARNYAIAQCRKNEGYKKIVISGGVGTIKCSDWR